MEVNSPSHGTTVVANANHCYKLIGCGEQYVTVKNPYNKSQQVAGRAGDGRWRHGGRRRQGLAKAGADARPHPSGATGGG
jgi:hypothetical protein